MLARKSILRPAAFVLLALAVYYCCLRYAFPGSFAPLVPYHPDAFGPVGLLERPWLEVFTYPRPVTFFFLRFEGLFGVAGSILISILVALAFALAIVYFVSRWSQTQAGWVAVVCFFVIFCAQPEFYFEHRHDVPIALSGILLLFATEYWRRWLLTGKGADLGVSVLLVAVLGLTKETYFASLAILFLGMVFVEDKLDLRRLALPLLGVAAAGILSLAITFAGFRRWVAPVAGSGTSYRVSLAPADLLQNFDFYASHLFNWAAVLILAVVLFSILRDRRRLLLAATFFLAGLAALLPNSVLPNHPAEQYSWDAVAFTFAPVLLVSGSWISSLLLVGASAVWLWANQVAYRSVPLQWRLGQEVANSRILAAFPRLHQIDPNAKRILVTGLSARLNPWLSEDYTHHEFGNREWTIVTTPDAPESSNKLVKIVHARNIDVDKFDYVVTFDSNGNLTQVLDRAALAHTPPDSVLIPELLGLNAQLQKNPRDPGTLLSIGIAYLTWGLVDQAANYLEQAADAGGGKNPYPYFFLGQCSEGKNDRAAALRYYQQAVNLDQTPRNPVFQQAVDRLSHATSPAP
jgi:tetratricopeptide (TPR) repeat protein